MKASKPSESESLLGNIDWVEADEDSFELSFLAIEDWISLALFLSLSLILVAQVLSRYVLNAPIGWTEEIARYQLILLSFIGASINFRKNSHISFVYFHRFIPSAFKRALSLLLSLINTFLLLFLLYTCVQIIPLMQSHEMSSISLSISTLYVFIGIALFACLLRSIMNTVDSLRSHLSHKQPINSTNKN